MMTVRITCGAFRFRAENGGRVTAYQGETVTISDAEAMELIGSGAAVAAYPPETGPEGNRPVEDANAFEKDAESRKKAPDGKPLEEMSFEELKAEAAAIGLPAGKLRSKQALRDAIAAAGSCPPDLSASEVIHGI